MRIVCICLDLFLYLPPNADTYSPLRFDFVAKRARNGFTSKADFYDKVKRNTMGGKFYCLTPNTLHYHCNKVYQTLFK